MHSWTKRDRIRVASRV